MIAGWPEREDPIHFLSDSSSEIVPFSLSQNIEIDRDDDGVKNREELSLLATLFTSLQRELVAPK